MLSILLSKDVTVVIRTMGHCGTKRTSQANTGCNSFDEP